MSFLPPPSPISELYPAPPPPFSGAHCNRIKRTGAIDTTKTPFSLHNRDFRQLNNFARRLFLWIFCPGLDAVCAKVRHVLFLLFLFSPCNNFRNLKQFPAPFNLQTFPSTSTSLKQLLPILGNSLLLIPPDPLTVTTRE